MANRFAQKDFYTLQKRPINIFCAVSIPTPSTGAPVLQKWNYPTAASQAVGSYSAAAAAVPVVQSAGNWPNQYAGGFEGVQSITRTGVGAWTVKFQDTFQRLMNFDIMWSQAGGLPAVSGWAINSTGTNTGAAGGASINIVLTSAAGVAADPTAGSQAIIWWFFLDGSSP